MANVEHELVPSEHSLLLLQVTPLPVYPVLQTQVNEFVVSAQVARPMAQLFVPSVHSFMGEQVTPFPVQPVLQAHVNEPVVSVQVAEPTGQLW